MKEKETVNLLLIMVLSIVLLVFLYVPQIEQDVTQRDFTNTKNEKPMKSITKKINSSIVYKIIE